MTLRAGWLAALLLAVSLTAQAAPDFPALTGRVVDNAQMIDPPVRAQLSQQLQALEQTSGDQIVVVTVPDHRQHHDVRTQVHDRRRIGRGAQAQVNFQARQFELLLFTT